MFTSRLESLRKEKGLTKKEVAEYLQIDQSTYGKYELGKREPDIETVEKLANFFGVLVDYLLGRTEIKNLNSLDEVEAIKDPDIRMISRAAQKMDTKKRTKMLDILKVSFEEEFEEEDE